MRKSLTVAFALLLGGACAFAQKGEFKWYGFVRTYFAYDSRESTAGTEDLYFYMPKDENIVDGEDLNAIPSFRFAALTSRLGVDVLGYQYKGYKIGGKIEADFYSGVSGVTGTAQMRLRQAFVTVAKNGASWKIGQAWHPMAADLPDIFSLESGAPFGPFSRTPQVYVEKSFENLSLSAAAIWQMQYTSYGPKMSGLVYTSTASADYAKYGCTPELYFALNWKPEGGLYRIGADVVSIKPRNYDYNALGAATCKVSDHLITTNFYLYAQQKLGNWTGKAKVTYAEDGSHFNLVGGYGVCKVNEDGSWNYTPTRSLNGWMTFTRKQKDCPWQPQILLGYIKEFGTAEDLVSVAGANFYGKNSPNKVAQMYRIQPEVLYNLGKLQFGLEYMLTGVQYGKAEAKALATEDLHWVANNRVQMMVKYTF